MSLFSIPNQKIDVEEIAAPGTVTCDCGQKSDVNNMDAGMIWFEKHCKDVHPAGAYGYGARFTKEKI